ncbi:MAG TPA: hypothetical protein VFR03_05265 [Thermoanaerobaculia bacterium]|nr:hypothetical protein [Thermoanaerobaculia bacterium]
MARGFDGFESSLFINCPFDREYVPLLQSLIFVVFECGLQPRIASEQADSGRVRIDKIRDLIRSCRYSVHDISRIEALQPGDEPRFNMPFELGLDLGCRYYGAPRLRNKRCLILEKERYRYHRVLSDISGNDIRAHGEDPKVLMSEVRNWLRVVTDKPLPSGESLWASFSLFRIYLNGILGRRRYSERDIQSLEFVEYVGFIRDWKVSGTN